MKKYLLLIISLVFTFCLVSCDKDDEPNYVIRKYGYYSYLDTISNVTIQFDTNVTSIEQMDYNMKQIDNILLDIEKTFSVEQTINMQINQVATSLLMNVNKNSGVIDENNNLVYTEVNDDFIHLLKQSTYVSELLNGSFDVTVGPLTNLWDITGQMGIGEEYIKIPTDEQIKDKLQYVDYTKVLIDEENKKVALPSGMMLDFGAIAKGYAADKVVEYVKTLDYEIVLIDLGGNIYTIGESPTTTSTIGIRNPFWNNESLEPYQLMKTDKKDTSIVTSGIYERYIKKDDVTYHHLLSPITGYPFDNEILSVSIIGESSALCDAIATGIYGLGLEAGIEKIKTLEGYSAVFITKDRNTYVVGDIEFVVEPGTDNFTFNYI